MAVAGRDLVLYVNPELPWLRALVDAVRARLVHGDLATLRRRIAEDHR